MNVSAAAIFPGNNDNNNNNEGIDRRCKCSAEVVVVVVAATGDEGKDYRCERWAEVGFEAGSRAPLVAADRSLPFRLRLESRDFLGRFFCGAFFCAGGIRGGGRILGGAAEAFGGEASGSRLEALRGGAF